MMKLRNITIEHGGHLVFILGPCVIESEEITLQIAERLKKHCPHPFIFKASFDKANRMSIDSFRGPGIDEGLRILQKVQTEFDLPVTTDIHLPSQANAAADVVDLIQIPAFLCRQTDLLVAAAQTKKPLHVKKGQFVAPFDMRHVVDKVTKAGCQDLILTDRGACFGYNNLVSDMRAIPIMKSLCPFVGYDATHSAQLPGGLATFSGGNREFIPHLSHAAVAAGADLIFMETHLDPAQAKSDQATQMPINHLFGLLDSLAHLHQEVKKLAYVAPR